MANGNPYDRRDAPRRGRTLGAPGEYSEAVDLGDLTSYEPLADGRRAYPGFGLHRLEQLLRDEFARGYNCGEGTLERRLEEEILPKAQREAWDEGARQGAAGGRAEATQELLERIAEKHEKPVDSVIEKLDAALEGEDVPFGEIITAARLARDLLEALRHDHHAGFPGEVPF